MKTSDRRMVALHLLVLAALAVPASQASTFQILHEFTSPDISILHAPGGAIPNTGPIIDDTGNLYGTAQYAGNIYCVCGTLWKISASGKFTVLYKFHGATDGRLPDTLLVRDSTGALYGTTRAGGTNSAGIIFKFSAGVETVFSNLASNPLVDGLWAQGITLDPAGNFYGATLSGGLTSCPNPFGQCGVIFKVDTAGQYSVLYRFTGAPDGANPLSGPIRDAAGNLYGTTEFGGDVTCKCGTVYKFDTNGTVEILKVFSGLDGQFPKGRLLMDKAGNLYGTTSSGGSSGNCNAGCGVIFKLSANVAGTWDYTVLHTFDNRPASTPVGTLIFDKYGTLWGTTVGDGGGTVFKMAKRLNGTWGFKVVHKFIGAPSLNPTGDLAVDQGGHIYGTTQECSPSAPNTSCWGVVFKITP